MAHKEQTLHEKYLKHAMEQVDYVQEGPRLGNQFSEDEAL